jgi:hypothetical protein
LKRNPNIQEIMHAILANPEARAAGAKKMKDLNIGSLPVCGNDRLVGVHGVACAEPSKGGAG